jgi:predicted SprT family Zn-dependent metalloprotease
LHDPERHPVLNALLIGAERVCGLSLADDLRLALRSIAAQRPRVQANGLDLPSIPPFGAEEGLAILLQAAAEIDRRGLDNASGLTRLAWSSRIFRVAGRAHLDRGLVELSWPLYCEAGLLAMGPILAHELIHLWLHRRRRPAGHGTEFARKSRELGLPEMSHRLRIESGGHRYLCPRCGRQIVRARRLSRPLACRRCCDQLAAGRYDPRFKVRYLGEQAPRHRLFPLTRQAGVTADAASARGPGRRPP